MHAFFNNAVIWDTVRILFMWVMSLIKQTREVDHSIFYHNVQWHKARTAAENSVLKYLSLDLHLMIINFSNDLLNFFPITQRFVFYLNYWLFLD